jgi:cobalt-zinc-cadmium efflux system outer membrane protein
MNSRTKTLLLLCICVVISFGSVRGEEQLKLDNLIEEALQNNPYLIAARHEIAAAKAQIPQARAWDPPQVGVDFYQTPVDSFPNPGDDWMEMDYFVQQMFPFPGKKSAMSQSAESNSAMTEQKYRALEKKIVRDLKNAFYNLYLVQQKIRINIENQDLMHEFTNIAKRQYEVGIGKQADILRAQTELSILINEGINLDQERRSAEAMINTILSRPTDGTLAGVENIVMAGPSFTFDQLKPLALDVRPELQSMRDNIRMNEADLSAAQLEYYPDFMFRVMYKDMRNTSDDYWSTMGAVNFPLAFWSSGKYKGKVEEKEQTLRKAHQDYRSMENMVLFQIQDALVSVASNQNLVSLYKNTLIPQAEQTLQSTTSAYQTGNMDFFSLIDAYRVLLMAKLNYHMSAMKYMESQAELEQAVGLSMDEIAHRYK